MPKIYDIHANLPANRGRKVDTRMKLVPGYGYVPVTREIDQVKAHNIAVEKAIQAKNDELSAEPTLEKSASVRRFEAPKYRLAHHYIDIPDAGVNRHYATRVPINSNYRDVLTTIHGGPDEWLRYPGYKWYQRDGFNNLTDSLAKAAFYEMQNMPNEWTVTRHPNGTETDMIPESQVRDRAVRYGVSDESDFLDRIANGRDVVRNFPKEYKKFSNGGPMRFFKQGGPRNWDNYFTGKLINYAENADSVGYDPKKKVWYAPPKNKGYDTNQFGMGVDRNQTEGFSDSVQKDNKGNEYLTEDDERKLRHAKIEAANKSANARYEYAKKFLGRKKYNVSKKKDAATVSAIYNLGPTHIANTIFENKKAMKALFDGTDEDYYKFISDEYEKKGRKDRIEKESKMLGFPIKKK